jgi:hypothetical protein
VAIKGVACQRQVNEEIHFDPERAGCATWVKIIKVTLEQAREA